MPKQPIKVNDDDGNVDNDSVTLSAIGGDEVRWTNNAPHPVEILFENKTSPFANWHFHAANGGFADSGPITNPTLASYKYDVKGAHGNNDPRIIIDR